MMYYVYVVFKQVWLEVPKIGPHLELVDVQLESKKTVAFIWITLCSGEEPAYLDVIIL